MSKNIELDKFYTPTETAKRCVDLMLDVVTSRFFVTEYLEPSAGSGSLRNLIDGCVAYDIKPTADNIIEADFLKLNLPYKKGRLIFAISCFHAVRMSLTYSSFGSLVASTTR